MLLSQIGRRTAPACQAAWEHLRKLCVGLILQALFDSLHSTHLIAHRCQLVLQVLSFRLELRAAQRPEWRHSIATWQTLPYGGSADHHRGGDYCQVSLRFVKLMA